MMSDYYLRVGFYYRNFFEMVRFDFVLDDEAHIYLMEVCKLRLG